MGLTFFWFPRVLNRYEDLGVSLRNTGRGSDLSPGLAPALAPPQLQRQASMSSIVETPLPESLDAVPGRVRLGSRFPGGHLYATERVFGPGVGDMFTGMVRGVLTSK